MGGWEGRNFGRRHSPDVFQPLLVADPVLHPLLPNGRSRDSGCRGGTGLWTGDAGELAASWNCPCSPLYPWKQWQLQDLRRLLPMRPSGWNNDFSLVQLGGVSSQAWWISTASTLEACILQGNVAICFFLDFIVTNTFHILLKWRKSIMIAMPFEIEIGL